MDARRSAASAAVGSGEHASHALALDCLGVSQATHSPGRQFRPSTARLTRLYASLRWQQCRCGVSFLLPFLHRVSRPTFVDRPPTKYPVKFDSSLAVSSSEIPQSCNVHSKEIGEVVMLHRSLWRGRVGVSLIFPLAPESHGDIFPSHTNFHVLLFLLYRDPGSFYSYQHSGHGTASGPSKRTAFQAFERGELLLGPRSRKPTVRPDQARPVQQNTVNNRSWVFFFGGLRLLFVSDCTFPQWPAAHSRYCYDAG